MRGRRPTGPEFVDRLPNSERARNRAKVVLQTMSGDLRVQEACVRLRISESRFDELRFEAIRGMVTSMEPKPTGRPPRTTTIDAAEAERLQQRVAELEAELAVATVRADLAEALLRAGRDSGKR